MKIVIICGSSRPKGQSRKISDWIEGKLTSLGAETALIDLHDVQLPLDVDLDVEDIHVTPRAAEAWEPTAKILEGADGFVVVSPEWNGMAPPALMNFFIYASADMRHYLAHKPIQLFTVSSTRGGNYPVAELKAYGPKNTKAVYLPNHVAVRFAKEVFNGPEPAAGNKDDQYIQKRAMYSLHVFLDYAAALTTMREATNLDLFEYPSGM